MKIHTLVFNDFGVNTYIVEATTGECLIIDAACYSEAEKSKFKEYITSHHLKPLKQLCTHCHIDHILGVPFVEDSWGIAVEIHADSEHFLRTAVGYASVFGFDFDRIVKAGNFISDGDIIHIGDVRLEVLHTPGHADGSLCFAEKPSGNVFTGDLLFAGSVGRTDLPTGNMDVLLNSINSKLMTLDDNTVVLPGHGPASTIGRERRENPFLNGSF